MLDTPRYWRSKSQFEVDFVFADMAIEVKAKSNVSASDLRGLRALREQNLFAAISSSRWSKNGGSWTGSRSCGGSRFSTIFVQVVAALDNVIIVDYEELFFSDYRNELIASLDHLGLRVEEYPFDRFVSELFKRRGGERGKNATRYDEIADRLGLMDFETQFFDRKLRDRKAMFEQYAAQIQSSSPALRTPGFSEATWSRKFACRFSRVALPRKSESRGHTISAASTFCDESENHGATKRLRGCGRHGWVGPVANARNGA